MYPGAWTEGTWSNPFGILPFGTMSWSGLVYSGNMYLGKRRSACQNMPNCLPKNAKANTETNLFLNNLQPNDQITMQVIRNKILPTWYHIIRIRKFDVSYISYHIFLTLELNL